jgi:hypothetical protein
MSEPARAINISIKDISEKFETKEALYHFAKKVLYLPKENNACVTIEL